MRVTSLKTNREYRKSSSFKAATLFLLLLLSSLISLGSSFYLYSQPGSDENKLLIIALVVIGVLPLLLIVIAGYLISVFVVTRINRMADTASEIVTTGNLTKRLAIDSRWDDLSFLAQVLNSMLDKIENLMFGVQHITDTIAHDLRTPLARLRNKLDAAEVGQEQSSRHLIEEVDGLLKTFNALLSLSSIESGRQSIKFKQFNMQMLIEDAIALYEPLANEKDQRLIPTSEALFYTGDRDLIFQVVANLLDNAIKFTPQGGQIRIHLSQEDGTTCLRIEDNGPGISTASKDKVFERFYREPGQQLHEGSGLGLSLVQAVIKLHHAEVSMYDCNPGLGILLKF